MLEPLKPYREWLGGIFAGAIIALAVWPSTRTVVRTQLKMLIPINANVASMYSPAEDGGGGPADYAAKRLHEAALAHPSDFHIQLANAMVDPPGDSSYARISRLRQLKSRFGSEPALYATILRFATSGTVHVHRQEEMQLSPPGDHEYRLPPSRPEDVSAFDADCIEGERLDPNNGFFPWMRAIGLFDCHRDAKAISEMQEAAGKPEWSDYCMDEVNGEWEQYKAAFGDITAMPKTGIGAALLLPHYSQLRATARIAVALAIDAEQKGDVARGQEIRDAVRGCGDLLTSDSNLLIGNLVGIAVTNVAYSRPGGAPILPSAPNAKLAAAEQRHAKIIANYEEYLRDHGYSYKTTAIQTEVSNAATIKTIGRSLQHVAAYYTFFPRIAAFWITDQILLTAALWMLLLGLAGTLALLSGRANAGIGLAADYRRGGYIAAISLAVVAFASSLGATLTQVCLPLFGTISISILLARRAAAEPKIRRFTSFIVFFAAALLIAGLCSRQIFGAVDSVATYLGITSDDSQPAINRDVLNWASFAAAAAVPVFTIVILAIVGAVCKVPLSLSVPRGLRGLAMPIALVLLASYICTVSITARQEAAIIDGLDQIHTSEVAYYANLAHIPWPAPVRR